MNRQTLAGAFTGAQAPGRSSRPGPALIEGGAEEVRTILAQAAAQASPTLIQPSTVTPTWTTTDSIREEQRHCGSCGAATVAFYSTPHSAQARLCGRCAGVGAVVEDDDDTICHGCGRAW